MHLPTPPPSRPDVVHWVELHLGGLFSGEPGASPSFLGGQRAADAALAGWDVTGYAARRNKVWPPERRGASRLSPYIRHGLLTLPAVWAAVAGGPSRDAAKFRDELLWQEYARHLYARIGRASRQGLRHGISTGDEPDPWPSSMACMQMVEEELIHDGWLVNQTRMWMASQWTVRSGGDWRSGEDWFFEHLVDGSRAANRLGWQWSVGTGTGRPYGFSRFQVEKRAPGLCGACELASNCPIQDWPDDPVLTPVDEHPLLRSDPDPSATAGPAEPIRHEPPEAVWVTAESLGDADPALRAHPDLPVVFVFDRRLLERLRLSSKRLVFIAECLADLAMRREVEVRLGDPIEVLAGRPVAATFTPVPGWRSRASVIRPVEVHPWPWLRRPHGRSVASFSAWRKSTERRRAT